MNDPIVQELLKKGYSPTKGVYPDAGLLQTLRLFKMISCAPAPGSREIKISRFDFTELTHGNKKHVEYEISSRFLNDYGEGVEVRYFNIDESKFLDKVDRLEHELSIAHIALNSQYNKS